MSIKYNLLNDERYCYIAVDCGVRVSLVIVLVIVLLVICLKSSSVNCRLFRILLLDLLHALRNLNLPCIENTPLVTNV